jgi:predicted NBD/HSP70 family sugar kinase
MASNGKGKSVLAVLDQISRQEQVAVADIVQETGLSAATVSRAVNELKRSKLVLSNNKVVTNRGRYPYLLSLNGGYGLLLHFHLDVELLVGYLFDFCGRQITMRTEMIDSDISPQVFGRALSRCEKEMLREANQSIEDVIAASVAIPGLVDRVNNRVRKIPNFPKLNDVNIFRFAEQALNIPVIVNNSARLSALGVQKYDYPDMNNVVYFDFTKQRGIGAGILLNGELFTGRDGFIGEIGDLLIGVEDFDRDTYDNEGCLETMASVRVLNNRLMALMKRGRAKILKQIMAEANKAVLDFHLIEKAVARRDLDVIDVFNSIMKMWSMMMINVSTVLNPDVMILGGAVNVTNELVLARVKHYVSKILNYEVNIELGRTNEYQMYGGLSMLRSYVLNDIVSLRLLNKM